MIAVSAGLIAACGNNGNPASSSTGGGTSTGGNGMGGDPYYNAVPAKPLAGDASKCPTGFTTAAPAGQSQGYSVDGQARSFYLALPDASKLTGPRPLIVLFNGTNETGQGVFSEWGMQSFVDAGFVVLAPDSNGNGTVWPVWDALRKPGDENLPNKDLDFFDSLVACTAANRSIDAERVYVAGQSAGGIMTNYVLERRSKLLAGGVVASGVLDLTKPSPPVALDPMGVIVTWGGSNDQYSGGTGTVQVPTINFVEQAALSSELYAGAPGVSQVWCEGKNLGHTWLNGANAWLLGYLLGHPKGLATGSPWKFVAPDASANYTCGTNAVPLPMSTQVTCGTSATAGCHELCQFAADCAVSNATVEPILAPQLMELGFGGTGLTDCSGCLTKCEAGAASGGSVDTGVLGCFKTQEASAQCGPGISGALPFVSAVNTCCASQHASVSCTNICTAINQNTAASSLFTACAGWP